MKTLRSECLMDPGTYASRSNLVMWDISIAKSLNAERKGEEGMYLNNVVLICLSICRAKKTETRKIGRGSPSPDPVPRGANAFK